MANNTNKQNETVYGLMYRNTIKIKEAPGQPNTGRGGYSRLGQKITIKGREFYLVDERRCDGLVAFPQKSYTSILEGKRVNYIYGAHDGNGRYKIREKKSTRSATSSTYSKYSMLGYELVSDKGSQYLLDTNPSRITTSLVDKTDTQSRVEAGQPTLQLAA